MKIIKRSSLYFQEDGSNKEYHIQLVNAPSGYLVNFQYGRIGQPLKNGTKTSKAVDKVTATNIYEKLYDEKTGKGYTEEKEKTKVRVIARIQRDFIISKDQFADLEAVVREGDHQAFWEIVDPDSGDLDVELIEEMN